MKNLNVMISDDVIAKFEDLNMSVMVAHGDGGRLATAIERRRAGLDDVQRALADIEPVTAHPAIALWRDVYGRMGVKPSKFRSSVEALLRRVQKDALGDVGVEVVDLYNLVSIHSAMPMGAYDLDKLSDEPLKLRFCNPEQDSFDPLGSSSDAFPLLESVVVYAQGNTVLCWGFNSRDAKSSSVEDKTSSVAFFAESFGDEGVGSRLALEGLRSDLADAEWQVSEIEVLNKARPSASLSARLEP